MVGRRVLEQQRAAGNVGPDGRWTYTPFPERRPAPRLRYRTVRRDRRRAALRSHGPERLPVPARRLADGRECRRSSFARSSAPTGRCGRRAGSTRTAGRAPDGRRRSASTPSPGRTAVASRSPHCSTRRRRRQAPTSYRLGDQSGSVAPGARAQPSATVCLPAAATPTSSSPPAARRRSTGRRSGPSSGLHRDVGVVLSGVEVTPTGRTLLNDLRMTRYNDGSRMPPGPLRHAPARRPDRRADRPTDDRRGRPGVHRGAATCSSSRPRTPRDGRSARTRAATRASSASSTSGRSPSPRTTGTACT